MQIVDIFYELARQHKKIRGFLYGKSYEKGAANEMHPLLWLDDPIQGQVAGNAIRYTVNFDVLGIPRTEEEVPDVQAAAFDTGLTMYEKLMQTRAQTKYTPAGFSFITLRDYYDNNAAGIRFTVTLTAPNPVDRCTDAFDPDKQFPETGVFPNFSTDNPDGCAVFNDKQGLPNFKISIK